MRGGGRVNSPVELNHDGREQIEDDKHPDDVIERKVQKRRRTHFGHRDLHYRAEVNTNKELKCSLERRSGIFESGCLDSRGYLLQLRRKRGGGGGWVVRLVSRGVSRGWDGVVGLG